ncbi:MAG: putative DNA binding domain-containing protein, partial [Sulfurovum sp.]|nr:putative DNA binding domain-containing protein [Sulfurovaceae bacterium]
NDIKKLILQNENRKLEFKEILPTNDKIIKTAIAFSNSQGGDLIIGICDDNTVVGVDEDEIVKLEEIISNSIYDNCMPNITPNIYSVRVEDKTLLVVHFYPSSSKPHYIKSIGKRDGSYVRVGSSNRVATLDILESLEREKRNIKLGATIGEVYREDRWEYPLLALREVIINAIVHRDYSILGSDIKIAIFDDKIEIISPGTLIIDKEKLGLGYSELRNPNLGNLLKKFEIIEQWGTGYKKIQQQLEEYPEIELDLDDESTFIQIKFIKTSEIKTTPQAILEYCKDAKTSTEIMTMLKLKDKKHFRSAILKPLISKGLLELTIPDKPKSPNQKYQTKESI